MRIAILAAALLSCAAPAAAQDVEPRIEVRTPIGEFAVLPGEPGFDELRRPPYRFRPGFLYDYQDRCRRDRCLVDVTRLRDGAFVGRITGPRAPRWLVEDAGAPEDIGPPDEPPEMEEPPYEDLPRAPDEEELLGAPD